MPASRERKQGETSPFEWTVAGACALLLLALIGYLLYDGLHASKSAPDPVVRVDSVTAGRGGYLVHLRVENHGRTTAAGLRLEGTLREGPRVVEQAEATMDYLPAEGARSAALVFAHDPRRYALAVRATGFELP